jgi:flagellar motor switch protein FliN/FliY
MKSSDTPCRLLSTAMPEITSEILTAVLDVARSRAGEIAEALVRGLSLEAEVQVDPPIIRGESGPDTELAGPGLAIVLTVGKSGAVFLLPESTQVLPEWYGSPDPTGEARLSTMAQELGCLLLPDEYMPDDFAAGYASNLADALRRGDCPDGSVHLPLRLRRSGGDAVTAHFVWPLSRPSDVLQGETRPAEPAPIFEPVPDEPAASPPEPAESQPPRTLGVRSGSSLRNLPPFTRSILRIRVPVVVTLAQKRQTLQRVLELGPGSILQFDKPCDSDLELEVGGRKVALGDAVKVGDKFGLRINSMVLPAERFKPIKGPGK